MSKEKVATVRNEETYGWIAIRINDDLLKAYPVGDNSINQVTHLTEQLKHLQLQGYTIKFE